MLRVMRMRHSEGCSGPKSRRVVESNGVQRVYDDEMLMVCTMIDDLLEQEIWNGNMEYAVGLGVLLEWHWSFESLYETTGSIWDGKEVCLNAIIYTTV